MPFQPNAPRRSSASLHVAGVALAVMAVGVAAATFVGQPGPTRHALAAVTGAPPERMVAPPAERFAAPAPAPSRPPAPRAPAAPQPRPALPAGAKILPTGKGMWIWRPEDTEGGNVAAIVARARAAGLSHVFVRTGSTFDGFYAQAFLDRLLPAAHAAGLRVFGWDMPYLDNADQDVARAVRAITYTAPGGNRLDGFTADIEVGDGQNVHPATVATYGLHLRRAVGAAYPLIACFPRPTPAMASRAFPYAQLAASFDALVPMVYWLNDDPAATATEAVTALRAFGKPVMPVGQAYDGAAEGGPPGVPPPADLLRFVQAATAAGASGYSFWDWQQATPLTWYAIRVAPVPRPLP